jgi:hypothetical protein
MLIQLVDRGYGKVVEYKNRLSFPPYPRRDVEHRITVANSRTPDSLTLPIKLMASKRLLSYRINRLFASERVSLGRVSVDLLVEARGSSDAPP